MSIAYHTSHRIEERARNSQGYLVRQQTHIRKAVTRLKGSCSVPSVRQASLLRTMTLNVRGKRQGTYIAICYKTRNYGAEFANMAGTSIEPQECPSQSTMNSCYAPFTSLPI